MKAVMCISLLVLPACSQPTSAAPDQSETINALNQRVDVLEGEVERLREARLSDRRFSVTLKPNADGYSTLGADEGMFPMQLIDVKPSGNGSRAVIRIANPTNATILTLSSFLKWGQTNERGDPLEPIKFDGRYTFDGEFAAGKWTDKEIPIPDLPPSKLGYIELSGLMIERVSLPTS